MKHHIVLDIGHANGTGARGYSKEEHAGCVPIVKLVAQKLRKKGYTVTVLDFPALSNAADLNKTIQAANKLGNVALGISFHMDASSNASARGGHVCYISSSGKAAALKIAGELCEYMPGRASHVVRRTNLGVLKRTKWRWVLIELGFITNKYDVKKLFDDPNTAQNELEPLVNTVVDGILKAL